MTDEKKNVEVEIYYSRLLILIVRTLFIIDKWISFGYEAQAKT